MIMKALNEHLETLAGYVFDDDKLVILLQSINVFCIVSHMYIYIFCYY